MSRSMIESLETRTLMSATAPLVVIASEPAKPAEQGIIAILIGLRQEKQPATTGFLGGVYVATGDIDGDGRADAFATTVNRSAGGLIDDPFFFDLGAE